MEKCSMNFKLIIISIIKITVHALRNFYLETSIYIKQKGPKGAVRGLADTHLADACALTKNGICLMCSYHACPCHDPWATAMRLSFAKAKSEFTTL
jgi:hypothetical protein